MTDDDKKRFALALGGLGEIFNEPVSKPKAAAYFLALRDLTIDQVEAAAAALLNTAKFFPKPVDFREALAGSSEDRGDSAWRTFVKLCLEEGHYPSLYVTDGAMAFAIEHLGGWIEAQLKIRDASPEMTRAYEKQFVASYRLGEKRQLRPMYFLGQIEAVNRSGGAMERARGREIRQAVCAVRSEGYQVLSMPFDLNTGALTAESRRELESGQVRKYLPAPTTIPVRYLPPATHEIAKPEEVALTRRYVENFLQRKSNERMVGEVEAEDVEFFDRQEAV